MTKCQIESCNRDAIKRNYCGMHYQRLWKHGDANYHLPAYTTCTVDGCGKKTRRNRSQYCETHYYRMYRNGTLKLKEPKQSYAHTGGYLIVRVPRHPAANGNGLYAYEHRVVFYDHHGCGPFQCHWCGKEVEWSMLHIDHLNDNKTDNRLVNLVASCARCNQARGHHKIRRTTKLSGRLITYNGVTMCLSDWARAIGITSASLRWRINNKWKLSKALTKERGVTGPISKKQKPTVIMQF